MKALSTAATGMQAQQLNVEVISNNIANLNTTGYKRRRAEFQDLLYQNIERVGTNTSDAGSISPTGIQVGVGVRAGAVYRIAEQGSLQITDNDYDLAINGKGYFIVQLPDGTDAYTRAGSFQIDDQGRVVTPEGFAVQPELNIPQEAISVTINEQGEVQYKLQDQVDPAVAGQLELAIFSNEAGLEAIGDNLLTQTQASGDANRATPGQPGFGVVVQGYLENSNVNAISEITNLITAQRGYEMNSKVIQAADEMLNTANQLR